MKVKRNRYEHMRTLKPNQSGQRILVSELITFGEE
jgi:hypothetical protein